MELIEIMNLGTSIYSGMPINHTVFIGHGGVWRTYQSVVSFFPFKTEQSSCSVNTKNLKNVLAKLTDATHKFTQKNLILKVKNISVRLPYVTTDKSDLTIFKTMQKRAKSNNKWLPIPNNFIDCVQACSKTVSQNALHGTLTCFCITDENEIMTSNNISLSIADLDGHFPGCLMNPSALVGAVAIKPTLYKLVDKYIIFKNEDNVIVQLPIVSGVYPDFGPVKDITYDEYIDLDTESLNIIAEISESLFEGKDMYDNTLKINVEDGLLSIENTANAGTVSANIDVDFKRNFSFTIDSKTLQLLTETNARIGIVDNKVVVESKSLKVISSIGKE